MDSILLFYEQGEGNSQENYTSVGGFKYNKEFEHNKYRIKLNMNFFFVHEKDESSSNNVSAEINRKG